MPTNPRWLLVAGLGLCLASAVLLLIDHTRPAPWLTLVTGVCLVVGQFLRPRG